MSPVIEKNSVNPKCSINTTSSVLSGHSAIDIASSENMILFSPWVLYAPKMELHRVCPLNSPVEINDSEGRSSPFIVIVLSASIIVATSHVVPGRVAALGREAQATIKKKRSDVKRRFLINFQ